MKRQVLFVVTILFSLSFDSVSARFFPNITGLPPLPFSKNGTLAPWDAFTKFAGCRSGEKRDGLAKLKQYFNEFGYIQNAPSNFSDDFDDELEKALRVYQQNFNLNVTGELDDQTLQKIVLPRCGNADIVNGTTSMNSGKSASFHTTKHFHTTEHFTFFPGTPRWPDHRQDLTYGFADQLTDEVKAVFARAFERWSAVTPLTFTPTDSYFLADIKIGFFTGDHGDGEPFDGVLGTLAHAFSPTNGRLHLDGAEDWVVAGDVRTSPLPSAVDLESVAVHEIGHLLGLGHSSDENAIMYPTISSRTRKVELGSDDVEGIQYLYGSNPNYNGSTSTTSTHERETSGGVRDSISRWSLGVILTVGFGFLLL
ncbi:Peptidase M10, metallopeptidase [Corchorus olitorius]|uniref:Peptidase M10, metallopeptidase n=1 Tax=Corchorus olitorius TaxID=93759 RepID=A0A1R3FY90_9ROSI|nr:Peptidase M10, metallopeptidase [Corchorus olitorius]